MDQEKLSAGPFILVLVAAVIITAGAVFLLRSDAGPKTTSEPGASPPTVKVAGGTWSFNDANFEREVLSAPVPVLVDFGASWCGPCRLLSPIVDELAGEFSGKVKIGKLDVDANRKTARQYGVSALPTVLVFDHGKIAQKSVGLTTKDSLRSILRSVLK